MSITLKISSALKVNNRFNISKQAFLLVVVFCSLPFLVLQIDTFSNPEAGAIELNLYPNIWTIFGIAVALFTAILAFIDYHIRREITIVLFGLTLTGSVLLDIYTLFILNNEKVFALVFQEKLYDIFLINRLLYGSTLLLGTAYYLNIKQSEVSSNSKKNKLILNTSIVYTVICALCFLLISSDFTTERFLVTTNNLTIDLFAFLPLILFGAWAFVLLPKFLRKFKTVFSKFLILSVAPIFLAQLFIAASSNVFDTYFNIAHYLRFISYIIPLFGIVFNYIETFKNEQLIVKRLDKVIVEKQNFADNLSNRERLLAQAQRIANIGSYQISAKGLSLNWSDELFNICGLNKTTELDYGIFKQIIDPNDYIAVNESIQAALKKGIPFSIEHQLVKLDGTVRFVLNQGYFSSEKQMLYGAIQDITELHEANLKLKANEALLREAEAVAHNGSWEMYGEKDPLVWSDEMYNLHGILPNSIKIRPIDYNEWVHPEDQESNADIFTEAKRNETGFEVNYRIIRADGKTRHLHTVAKRKITKDNSIIYLGNTQDVTDLKEAERKLKEKVDELDASNKDLEQFAYIASHDLQEPLRKIRAFGERLKSKFSDEVGEEGKDYIERMQNAAERMQILIDDLLSFAKASRNNEKFQKFDLNELLQQVIGDLEYTIEQTSAEIIVNTDQKVFANPGLLRQVFQNIMSNSLKFTKTGVAPKIEISTSVKQGIELGIEKINHNKQYCVITVKDNGIGFNQAYASKIFDLFQRLHNKASFKGTGLGLAICKKIIENHSGFIIASSEEGNGASFFIILPLN